MAESHRIALALFHRDHLSRGKNRQMLGYEALHWGIFVIPVNDEISPQACEAFDATDAAEIDPATWRMSNPTMDWWLRIRPVEDIELYDKLLGYIILGEISRQVPIADLRQSLKDVPLPIKNMHPQQSCVTWAVQVVLSFQEKGWLPKFEVKDVKEFAVAFADKRLKGEEERKCVNYFSG